MFKNFRLFFVAIASIILLFSCLKKSSKKDVPENLKTAMGLYLNHRRDIDTSRVKFKVLEVAYYEAKAGYICEFKVNMQTKVSDQIKDTIGTMTANISKDFKDVSRRN